MVGVLPIDGREHGCVVLVGLIDPKMLANQSIVSVAMIQLKDGHLHT